MSGRRWPFIYTIVSAIVCYGVILVIYSTNVGERWAEWVASALFWLLAVVVYYWSISFFFRIINTPTGPWEALLEFMDVYLSTLHAIAGVGMSIYLLDTAPGKDTWLVPVVTTASPYAIFVGDFLYTATLVINGAGFATLTPTTSTVIGSIWGIFMSITGPFLLIIVISLVMRSIKKTVPLTKEVMKQARKTRANITPMFKADYAGMYDSGNPLRRVASMDRKELPNLKNGVKRANAPRNTRVRRPVYYK
jgi:hypothetical protein